jgi:hypothetical protein
MSSFLKKYYFFFPGTFTPLAAALDFDAGFFFGANFAILFLYIVGNKTITSLVRDNYII